MHIHHVTIGTRDLDATETMYRDTFGFPTTRDGESVVVRMGATTVAFRAEPTLSGTHHLAWTIPTGTFDAAVAWASERVPLLLGNGGASVFEAPPTWDARSVYVDGPDGQLLELIERRALPASPRGAGFTADDIVRVSEVGVAVPDVVTAVDACAAAGVASYGSAPDPGFSAVGDVDGLLVLVPAERRWFPAHDREPANGATTIVADVPRTIELAPGRVLVPRSR